MLKNVLTFLFVTLLLTGCEQKHFSHVYDKKEIGATIHAISITNQDTNNSKLYQTTLKKQGFKLKNKSHYSLQTQSRLYPKKCNNPLATAEQKNYIGFVQLTLLKDDKKLYMCQSDFKKVTDIEDIIKGLVQIMIKEMKIIK
jgi:hypothetical protein